MCKHLFLRGYLQKGKSPDFINCDDVYYGTGTSKAKFYFTFIGKW